MQQEAARLMTEGVDVGAAVFHQRHDAGRPGARAVPFGLMGVAVPAVERVEVAGLVAGEDGHSVEAGLFQVVDAGG